MQTKLPINKKSITVSALILFSLLIGLRLITGGDAADGKQTPAPLIRPVKTIHLTHSSVTEQRAFPGIVSAARETDLAFRVSGPLVDLNVRIGRLVKRGDVLARIDPRDFEISQKRLSAALQEAHANLKAMRCGARAEDVARIKAQLAAAQTKLTNAKNDLERHRILLENKVIPQARFDEVRSDFDTAAANAEALQQELKKAKSGARIEDIEAAEARIQRLAVDFEAAENALEDTRLKAPFDGYVSRRFVENYENVRAGEPVVSFFDVSTVQVDTAVTEDLIIHRSAIGEIQCTLEAYPGQFFKATIKEIGQKTDSANQSYPLTVTLHIPEGRTVAPGMAATLHVALDRRAESRPGFALPASAVFADADGQTCVWCVNVDSMQVVKVKVDTGPLKGDTIRVLNGLIPGDQVVTAGARFLRNGQQVRILAKRGERPS